MKDHTSSKEYCKIETRLLERVGVGAHLLRLLLCLLALLIAAIVILAWVPPVSRDALVHHLAVPKLYMRHGGIYEIPSMLFSYYPMNLDLLYLIPIWFGNDIVPKFIHFSFGLLTAWLIFAFLKQRAKLSYALFSALLFLSLPIIVKLSITVYADLGIVFFSTASLLLILRWINRGFPLKLLIFSAISCGLAMGTKYNGLITLLLLVSFVPFIYAKYGPKGKYQFSKSCVQGLIFLFVAVLVFSPWMIRNYLWTQNPIYPLFDQWVNPYETSSQSIGIFAYRSLVYHEEWWEIALLPIRIFFQGQDNNPQYFDGMLNPALFILPFFAFCFRNGETRSVRREKNILLTFVILYFGFAFFLSHLRIRYILPIVPPLVILSVMGVRNLCNFDVRSLKPMTKCMVCATVFLAVTIFLVFNLYYVLTQYRLVNPLSYLSGSVDREEYISRYRPEYPVIRYVNENLAKDALILFIFMGNRGYYCDREYIFDMYKTTSIIRQLVEQADNVEEILDGLGRKGITHLFLHREIFGRWVEANFSPEGRILVRQFFANELNLLYSHDRYALYGLKKCQPAGD